MGRREDRKIMGKGDGSPVVGQRGEEGRGEETEADRVVGSFSPLSSLLASVQSVL